MTDETRHIPLVVVWSRIGIYRIIRLNLPLVTCDSCHSRTIDRACRHLTMTIPAVPPNLRRRQMHNVSQSNSAKARLLLAVACLWPLLVFFFASSGKNTEYSPDVVSAELESIRNLLDRVDILGYGPTHPRVAVVVVGDDTSKILSTVESVFRYETLIRK